MPLDSAALPLPVVAGTALTLAKHNPPGEPFLERAPASGPGALRADAGPEALPSAIRGSHRTHCCGLLPSSRNLPSL